MVEQNISLFAWIEFIGLTLTIIISAIAISRTIKKSNQAYTDSKLNVMDVRITAIDKEMVEFKKDNQREHDQLKKDFFETVNRIWDWIQKRA